jgi:hypothetical protein
MLRSQSVVSLLLVVLIGFIVTHPVAGYNGDDYSWAVPGDNVEAGQIYIQIEPTFAPLKIEVYDGIVMTGLPDLDAVADAFGVYRLEKTYMMQETPKDPAVPDLSRYCTVYFPEEFGPVALIEAYETCPQVVLAEFVSRNKMFYVPNDPRYRNQWYLRQIDLPGAWDVTHGSSEVVIGIIDSGLDMDADGHMGFHEDFQRNIWINYGEDIDGDSLITLDDWNGEDDDENGYPDDFHGWNFSFDGNWPDDNWGADDGHGTLVAGVASADTDNETGISGAGFNCKLMITAHFDPHDPDGGIIYGYRGVEYCAANDADIINLSWGSYSETNATERAAINYALQRGTLVFAAAGNENREDDVNNRIRPYPSAYDGVIGVAASDQDDRRAEFSDYGDHVDLVAPGVGMLSTFPRNDYYTADGTSFSHRQPGRLCGRQRRHAQTGERRRIHPNLPPAGRDRRY